MARILIIDDDHQVRTMLRRTLEADGHEVEEAGDGNEGISKYQSNPADLMITDIFMPEKECLETIIELKRHHPDVRILAISGGSRDMDLDFLPVAAKLGAEKTLNKPIDRRTLLSAVNELVGDGHDGPPEANVA